MALVLCTSVDSSLLTTRRLILESAGHKVVTVTNETALLAACKEHSFDVAVIGKMLSQNVKRRIALLVREHCPDVKVLELYEAHLGPTLDDADSWMITPADVPRDLVDRVDQLAGPAKKNTRGGAQGWLCFPHPFSVDIIRPSHSAPQQTQMNLRPAAVYRQAKRLESHRCDLYLQYCFSLQWDSESPGPQPKRICDGSCRSALRRLIADGLP